MHLVYTFFKIFTLIFLIVLLVTSGWIFIRWYSDSDYKIGSVQKGDILTYTAKQGILDLNPECIKIVSYNLGFAAGQMQHTLADFHPKSFFIKNLDCMIAMIKSQRADIVLLQEVDLNSKRSWYFNQLDYIMKKLGWKYAAPVVDWNMYFPLRKEHKIKKATVVISKYPIVSNSYTETSAKSNFENWMLNVFYYPLLWKSTMQKVGIDLGGRILDIYNVHLCVWRRSARVAQTKFLVNWIKSQGAGHEFIIGGDFNFQAYIRGTPVPEADMEKAPFMNILWDNLDGIGEIRSTKNSSIGDIHYNYTFPERKHRYDFIFYSNGLRLDESEIIESIPSSDHLPVSGGFCLKF